MQNLIKRIGVFALTLFIAKAHASWCSNDEGSWSLYPDHYPAEEIFLGDHSDPQHQEVRELILSVFGPQKVKLFKSKNASWDHPKALQPGMDDIIWAQDMWEVFRQNEKKMAMGLPYVGQDGLKLVQFIGEKLPGWQVQTDLVFEEDQNGNFGGNIEALPAGLLLVGNNLSANIFDWLSQNVSSKILKIDVSWLEVGHVDELFGVAIDPRKSGLCNFKIFYASPALALDLLPLQEQGDIPVLENQLYERAILKAKAKIGRALKSELNCFHQNQFEALPVVFQRDKILGDDRGAQSVFPNPVNFISNQKDLIVPDPGARRLRSYLENKLHSLGYRPHLIDTDYLNKNGGNLHCISKVVRKCL